MQQLLISLTHKIYKPVECKYLNFCTDFSIIPIPMSENVLCYFIACMGQHGLASPLICTDSYHTILHFVDLEKLQ